MNLIMLTEEDCVGDGVVRLTQARARHIRSVHRAAPGDQLRVGLLGGPIGQGLIESIDETSVTMRVSLTDAPPAPLNVTLLLALPRPKVLGRVIASAASMGIKRIALFNAWKVEKSYWKSPQLRPEVLRRHCIAGLEQGRDTVLPAVTLHRFFRRFVEEELASIAGDSRRLVAHPGASDSSRNREGGPVTIAVGPEGGFIDVELDSLVRAEFERVSFGVRPLRVETIVPALVGWWMARREY